MTHDISRRRFTAAGAVAAGIMVTPLSTIASTNSETLADIGRAKGIEIGSAIKSNPHPKVAAAVALECSIITPENALKPTNILNGKGEFNWEVIESTNAFARSNGLKIHGHTLFWYKHPLISAELELRDKPLTEVIDIYSHYFSTVIKRFPEIESWDVFNEITGTHRPLRASYPITEFGIDFIDQMLQRARELAPDAKLVINENDLECGFENCSFKRDNALKLLRSLRDRGAPLDAIGIQAHLSSRHAPSEIETLAFIDEVAALGLDVYISEMDVNDIDLGENIRRRDDQVAEIYHGFLTTVLKSPAVKRVVFWGITDLENWIANDASVGRKDGIAARPALFDRYLGRKPAYYAVREALAAAPKR